MPSVVAAIGKWLLHSRGARLARRFDRQIADCQRTQQQTLHRLLAANAGTRFQSDHGLAPNLSVDAYRRTMPLTTYADVAAYVDAVKDGDANALCGPGNRVLMFALTSGTTGATKHIPVTSLFLRDYRRGWHVWGFHTFEKYHATSFQKFLQIASDHDRSRTPAGLPCGNISGLVQSMQTPFVRSRFVLPGDVVRITDPASKLYVALRLALAEEDVGLITAANPSTLVQMAQQAHASQESLIRDVHDGTLAEWCELPDAVRRLIRHRLERPNPGRARDLSRLAGQSDRLRPQDYWPNTSLVAVWTGGSAGAYLPAIREWYGDVPIRDHGLSASEGRMTIPIEDETAAGVLDVASHFFEFIPAESIDQEDPPTLLAHELERGGAYFVVLTTASGLYRYNIYDVVRCTGFLETTPLLEFLHKGAHISSVTGEKLTESQVVAAMTSACERSNCRLSHYTVCPVWDDPPAYRLLVEQCDLSGGSLGAQLAGHVESELQSRNCEYREKRMTGRLGALKIQLLPPGTWSHFIRAHQSRPGASAEQYKHACLQPDLTFHAEIMAHAECPHPDTFSSGTADVAHSE